MARTRMPGKRTILVRNVEVTRHKETRRRSNPKLIYVKIDSDVYLDAVKTSHTIGRLLYHTICDLHLMSLDAMLFNLELAKNMVAALLDKPSKQLAGVQKLIDNAREKMELALDMEHTETRQRIMQYITEHILRYDNLGELHGFIEVTSKKR